MSASIVKFLAAAHPGLRVSVEAAVLSDHAKDWWPRAAKWTSDEQVRHTPACVVFPRNEKDCISVIEACHATGASVVAYGAGSGVVGAVVPDRGAVTVDMGDLDEIVAFNPQDCFVTVGSGRKGGELEAWLNERGFTLGHYPQSLHLASIGGLISTRSTGTFSNKYGGIEQLVLGLRVVGTDGKVTEFRNVPRNSSGPALQQIFIGAEGTLGLVTEATLRIFPQAETRLFEGFTFPTIAAGIEAVRKTYAAHLAPAVLRLYDETEARNLYRRVGREAGPPLLIAGFEGLDAMTKAERAAFTDLALAEGGHSIGEEIGTAWEAHRFDASWLSAGNDGPGRMADAIEISLPWSMLAEAHRAIIDEVAPHCATVMSHYSHFYSTGGALYVIVLIEGADRAAALNQYGAVWKCVMQRALDFGGSLAHHHGIGRQRSPMLEQELGSSHELLRRIKAALDPKNLFNPGKLGLDAGVVS